MQIRRLFFFILLSGLLALSPAASFAETSAKAGSETAAQLSEAEMKAAEVQAEAEAEAIMKVQQATAEAIKLINEANPGEGVIKIRALEAFQAVADGRATKLIIPSEIQGLAGLCASAKTVFDGAEANPPKPKA